MLITTLDIGTRMGLARGEAGGKPESFAITLKKGDDPQDVAFGNLIAVLDSEFRDRRPDLLVIEAQFSNQAFERKGASGASRQFTNGLHAIARGMRNRYGLRLEAAHPATVRKHFIGHGNMGARNLSKQAVVQRAQLLGLLPKHVYDEDRADALAMWDWASAHFGSRVAQHAFHLFGERPRANA